MPTPRHTDRAPGSGSIHAKRNGKHAVYSPSNRPGGRGLIGRFEKFAEAQRALDEWLRANPETAERRSA